MKKNCLLLMLLASTLTPFTGKAGTVSLDNYSFSVSIQGGPTVTTTIYGARWGVWNSTTSTFTELQPGGTGYYQPAAGSNSPELSVYLNQTDNSLISIGAPLAMAIYTDGSGDDQALTFNNALLYKAVLVDSAWIAPTFTTTAGDAVYDFSAGTSAVVGSFTFNGGNGSIALVPEPSTGALMMIGAVGLVALRRLRKV